MAPKLVTIAVLAMSVAGATLPSVAMAHDRYDGGWDRGDAFYQDGDSWRHRGDDGRRGRGDYGYDRRAYAENGSYYADGGYYQRPYRQRHSYRCHRDGSTGAIIGALAGGLLGNGIAGRGDRTLGTILGGGAGALAGRAIERSGNSC